MNLSVARHLSWMNEQKRAFSLKFQVVCQSPNSPAHRRPIDEIYLMISEAVMITIKTLEYAVLCIES
jgi:hypothetical protein